jgi:raffinose/stachyose/melibiose transport system permease protein
MSGIAMNNPVSKPAGQVRVGSVVGKSLSYVVFVAWACITILPLVWLGYSSFKTNAEITASRLALPTAAHVENYSEAWRIGKLGTYFVNSIVYTGVTCFGIIMLSMMASYGFAKMRYRRTSNFLYGMLGIGMLISVQAILIPLFLMLKNYGLINTYPGIILTYITLGLPMAIYLGTDYIKGIPDSLIESAYIDGAGNFRMFWSIILPMTKPVIVTMSILNVLSYWNEFLMVFVLTMDDTMKSLPVGVMSFVSPTSQQWDKQFAALVISLLPILAVYFTFQKKLTQGVVAGAVKG